MILLNKSLPLNLPIRVTPISLINCYYCFFSTGINARMSNMFEKIEQETFNNIADMPGYFYPIFILVS